MVLSYRQAIAAYPNGGGSYVVARDNLGRNVGLVAAAALHRSFIRTDGRATAPVSRRGPGISIAATARPVQRPLLT